MSDFDQLDKWIDKNAPGLNKKVLHTQVASEIPEPTGTKSITTNGDNIDVKDYASVNVNVPASAVVSGTKSITANGISDVTTYANVNVNVQAQTATTHEIQIENNSSYSLYLHSTPFVDTNNQLIRLGIVQTGTTGKFNFIARNNVDAINDNDRFCFILGFPAGAAALPPNVEASVPTGAAITLQEFTNKSFADAYWVSVNLLGSNGFPRKITITDVNTSV